jgi:hypothetical protein
LRHSTPVWYTVRSVSHSNGGGAMAAELVVRSFGGTEIGQRNADGYFHATAMCKANGRLWADYWRNSRTQEFVAELASDMGIPISLLVESHKGVTADGREQGTWVHPDVAVHLAQWLSPKFAVRVARWVRELLETGRVDLKAKLPPGAKREDTDLLLLDGLKALAEHLVGHVYDFDHTLESVRELKGWVAEAMAGMEDRIVARLTANPPPALPPAPVLVPSNRTKDKRAAVTAELLKNPALFDSEIVRVCLTGHGVSVTRGTVSRHRRRLEAERKIEPQPVRSDRSGGVMRPSNQYCRDGKGGGR